MIAKYRKMRILLAHKYALHYLILARVPYNLIFGKPLRLILPMSSLGLVLS